MSLETRIKLEMRGRKPQEVRSLNLDNSRAQSLAGLTEEFENLESLSLINVGLTTLKGFPALPNLRKLELSDNRLTSTLDHLKLSPKLQYVNISGNKVKEISSLEPLKDFPQLKALDLFNCDVTECVPGYREKVFALLPQLVYLDGLDKDEVEMPDDEDILGLDPDSADDDDDDDEDDDDDDEDDDDKDEDNDDDDEEDVEDEDDVDDVEVDKVVVAGEDDDDEEEDDEDEDEVEDIGLAYLQKSNIDEDSEGEDFAPGNEDEDDDEIEDDDDEEEKADGNNDKVEDDGEPSKKKTKVSEEDVD